MESQPLVTQSDIGQLSLGYGASQPFQLTQNTELTQLASCMLPGVSIIFMHQVKGLHEVSRTMRT
eukprot:scaffold142230_cov18-Tisochrysis_lutea.AAC.2